MRSPPSNRSVLELLSFGVVNIDKPPGPSAHEVAAQVRELAGSTARELGGDGIDRAAHTGTLDPKVTGVLPILLGDATRLASVLADADKQYVAVLELHGPPPRDLEDVLAEFEGELYQKPPRKSAVRRRLRTRRIHRLEILDRTDRQLLLRIGCAAGTYVRKLCHDLGLALGTGAHMGDLRRTAAARFDDRTLATLYDFTDALAWAAEGDTSRLRELVAPAETALEGLPKIIIAPSAAEEVAHGAPVYAPGVIEAPDDISPGSAETGPQVACFTPEGTAICLGRVVGDPDAAHGTVVSLDRVLVSAT